MKSIVMMGVAGCGKSFVGQLLAQTLGLPLVEGDEFHSEHNREKMRQGLALTDADRADWLAALGQALEHHAAGAVLTCSALKRAYRDRLRRHAPGLRFVFLDVDARTAHERVTQRATQHLFPASLVASQFAALESPIGEPGVLRVDATQTPEHLRDIIVDWLDCA